MRPFLTSLLRPLVWSAIAITLIAIVIGRSSPRTLPSQHQAVPRYHGINGQFFSRGESIPRFFDRETGQFLQVDFPAEDSLDYAVCSPWCDDRGQFQLVGRWMNRDGHGNQTLPQGFGLARYTFPEVRVIQRIALDVMPMGEPCWVPGLTPRILFTAGDGQLYRYSFEEADGLSARDYGDMEPSQPSRLEWRTALPGVGPLFIKDLIWPSDPRLGGRLIASLSYQVRSDGNRKYVGSHLWWLRLSGDGTAVEAAGRLTAADETAPVPTTDGEERLANLATTPEGGLAIAYLSRSQSQTSWDLRVAPVAIAPVTGTPMVGSSSPVVVGHCVAAIPMFSTDGRWVYGMLGGDHGESPIMTRRFSVAGALAQSAATGSGPVAGPESSPPVRSDFAGFVTTRLVDGRARHHARR